MVMATMVCAVVALSGGGPVSAGNGAQPPHLEFLGQAIVPTGTTFGGTVVGGLSSITYDPALGVFYSLSDDQSQLSPARFYTLRVDVSDGHLDNGDVEFLDVTTLLAPDGQP
jgi:3-phytase/alkaline phosphatase D